MQFDTAQGRGGTLAESYELFGRLRCSPLHTKPVSALGKSFSEQRPKSPLQAAALSLATLLRPLGGGPEQPMDGAAGHRRAAATSKSKVTLDDTDVVHEAPPQSQTP